MTDGGSANMDDAIRAVLDLYHTRMIAERAPPRQEAPGGRDGGLDQRMRAIGPDTGQLLNILVRSLITMERHDYKSAYARQMAQQAGLADWIDFRIGDAVAMTAALEEQIDFVFVDLWKDLYVPCLEAFYPRLRPGAIIVADNMIRPGTEDVKRYGRAVRALPGISSILLPVGTGIEVSRFEPQDRSGSNG